MLACACMGLIETVLFGGAVLLSSLYGWIRWRVWGAR